MNETVRLAFACLCAMLSVLVSACADGEREEAESSVNDGFKGRGKGTMPHTHKQAERKLIAMVRSGEWEIDTLGRVWRTSIRTGNRWSGGFRLSPVARRRAEGRLPSGYMMVRAELNGARVVGVAHRLVWQHFHGDIPDGMVINHRNGQKDDNRPENLEVVTPSGNTRHAYATGLMDEHGERNPAAKLSDHDVAAIRLAYASGAFTYFDLADKYGVQFQQISRIVRGERRPKQGGPLSVDNRPKITRRDPVTGRVLRKEAA